MLFRREASLDHATSLFFEAMKKKGIRLPTGPESGREKPRDWLIRAETQTSRFIGSGEVFQPQHGEIGSYGVFFGDCLEPVPISESSVVYAFRRDSLSPSWVQYPSDRYQKLIQEVAQQQGLNLNTIRGGAAADFAVASQHCIYNAQRGIATIPWAVSMRQANQIFIMRGAGQAIDQSRLPGDIRGKLVLI